MVNNVFDYHAYSREESMYLFSNKLNFCDREPIIFLYKYVWQQETT